LFIPTQCSGHSEVVMTAVAQEYKDDLPV